MNRRPNDQIFKNKNMIVLLTIVVNCWIGVTANLRVVDLELIVDPLDQAISTNAKVFLDKVDQEESDFDHIWSFTAHRAIT